MDGYIRVSQVGGREGERFMSPDMQREAVTGWANTHGVHIAAWHEDMTQSGGTMDRPGMNAALDRVRAGKTSGVIVARLDRFARTLMGGLRTIEELRELDARVVSVAESIDPQTPMGRAMLGLLLVMAEWQRDQADEALASAQQRATDAGRYPTRTAYGYRRDEDGQVHVDEAAAVVVRRIFEERAAGVGWRKIADQLSSDGILTPYNQKSRWGPSTVNGIVRSESPLGVFSGPRGLRVEDAWPPIIDKDLWDRANAVRGTRDNSRRYEDRLFAGIARCAGCRLVLARAVNPHGFVSYGCPTRGCRGGGSIGAGLFDSFVSPLVDERLARIVLEPRLADDGGEVARLVAARDAALRELELWRDDVGLRAALGDHDWREGMLTRARARDDAEAVLKEHQTSNGLPDLDMPAGVVPTLDMLPWAVRRCVVEALLHSVWIRPSKARGAAATQRVGERILVVWRDDPSPPDLPSLAHGDLAPVCW